MFYGLNRAVKKILPKRLFYRGLLIVAVPIIGLQLIISIVFFDSLWIKTNKGMTRALVGEIKTFMNAYENEEFDKEFLIILFREHLGFNVKYEPTKSLPKKFRDDFLDIKKKKPELVAKNGLYEKDMLRWVSYDELKKKYENF